MLARNRVRLSTLAYPLSLLCLLAAVGTAQAAYRGLSLTEALLALQDRGLKIAFTSHLVRPEMRVLEEPTASGLAEILDELLRPHALEAKQTPEGLYVVVPGLKPKAGLRGLVRVGQLAVPLGGVKILVAGTNREAVTDASGLFELEDLPPDTYTVEAHLPGFVVGRQWPVSVEAGRVSEVDFRLEPAPIPLDEIVVTPSRARLLKNDPVPALAFDRDEVLALPHLGDDLFRALSLLPGVSGNERSAQFSIRGGRPDEVLVILDGLELFEPFHIRDFGSAFSIIAPRAIGEVDLIVGGFPAEYGDRMGGVLEMNTVAPDQRSRGNLGIALLSAEAGTSGILKEGRGNWIALARRGGTDLMRNYLDEEEKPRFWDAFGKWTRRLGERHEIGARLLHANDDLSFSFADEEETAQAQTDYGNSYLWFTHQSILGPRFVVDSALSVGRVHRERTTAEVQGDENFSIIDKRDMDIVGFKQAWNFVPGRGDGGDRQFIKWGFDLRRLDIEYDYISLRQLEDPLDDIRTDPRSGETRVQRRFDSNQVGLYAADRLRPGKSVTVELGLRYDEQSITGDRNISPRLNLVWAIGQASTLRMAWGHYFQNQRIYELQVEDGVTELAPAERTEAFGLGFEHVFTSGMLLRVNGYDRSVADPRSRFENIIEPISVFPEIEPDRVLIVPESSSSRGVEIFLRGRSTKRVDWWASYAYARTMDRIDGRDVPRSIDQPHTFNMSASIKAGRHWTVNLAWRYHTGWPTTAASAVLEEDDGESDDGDEPEPILIFGPFNAERLSDYHRLDMRASRRWALKKRGMLTFYIELQNLYGRGNVAGFDVDYEFEFMPGGQVEVIPVEEIWGEFLPSIGIDWEF